MDERYDCLEQRMVQTYRETLPPFVPSEDGPSAAEQEQFYHLMDGLYALLCAEPQLIVRDLHEDDAFPNRFNRAPYGKPELNEDMRKATKAVDALLEAMVQMGRGVAAVSKRHQAILARLDVNPSGPPPEAWTWMATKPSSSLLSFSRCFFQDGYPYASAIYARLLGDEALFHKLESRLIEWGYTRFDCLKGALSVEYANLAWDAEQPRGGFEYKIRHTGFSCRYDAYVAHPAVLGLCIPHGLKAALEAFGDMDESVQEFVMQRGGQCSACGYCTQTDKTGKRPRAHVGVAHGGKSYRLCPYFPGYRYSWEHLDEALADNLLGMLAFLDALHSGTAGRASNKSPKLARG